MKQIQFTPDGHQKLLDEKETLIIEREDAVGHVRKSREMGDLSENGYYQASKSRLRSIDGRLGFLAVLLKQAVITSASSSEVIQFGSRVTVLDTDGERIFSIVEQFEANPLEGKLSIQSPLGKVLMGRKVGEKVTITTPKGEKEYTVKKVE